MADPTEAEQQKQTQALESLEKKSDQQQTQIGKLTSILKEGNAFAVMAHDETMGEGEDEKEFNKLRADILNKSTKVQEKTLEAKEKEIKENKILPNVLEFTLCFS